MNVRRIEYVLISYEFTYSAHDQLQRCARGTNSTVNFAIHTTKNMLPAFPAGATADAITLVGAKNA